MAALKLALLTAVLLGLVVLMACNDSDEDEKRASHSNGTAQTAAPQKRGKSLIPMKAKRVRKVQLFPLRWLPKNPPHSKPTASSSSITLTVIPTGSFPENSMLPAQDRAARANGLC